MAVYVISCSTSCETNPLHQSYLFQHPLHSALLHCCITVYNFIVSFHIQKYKYFIKAWLSNLDIILKKCFMVRKTTQHSTHQWRFPLMMPKKFKKASVMWQLVTAKNKKDKKQIHTSQSTHCKNCFHLQNKKKTKQKPSFILQGLIKPDCGSSSLFLHQT